MDADRNHLSTPTPINRLPSEVLANILELVVIWEYQKFPRFFKNKPPRYPAYFGRVSPFWHKLIHSTPVLWSRIDLVPSEDESSVFYSQASRFLELSSSTPLSIRIHGRNNSSPNDAEKVLRWLIPVMNRVRSLELLKGVSDVIMEHWIENGTPGLLKELSFHSQSRIPRFIIPNSGSRLKPGAFTLSPHRMADLFQPITSLNLSGLFPPWENDSYRGVVHLSLSNSSITEKQLVAMLSSAPQIQTLSLDLEIKKTSSSDVCQIPVHLRNLETLNIHTNMHNPDLLRTVLKILVPGPLPLKTYLSIDESQLLQLLNDEESGLFFQRSCVTHLFLTLRLTIHDVGRQILSLITKLPSLRALCIAAGSFSERSYQTEAGSEYPQLRELCLSYCDIYQNVLEALLSLLSPQLLKLDNCAIFSSNNRTVHRKNLVHDLSQIVPSIEHHEREDANSNSSYLFDSWEYIYF